MLGRGQKPHIKQEGSSLSGIEQLGGATAVSRRSAPPHPPCQGGEGGGCTAVLHIEVSRSAKVWKASAKHDP